MLTGDPTKDAGRTEDGSYVLNGATSEAALQLIIRAPDATWVIPSEDEWYKAAYYDGGGDVYYDYPTGSDSVPMHEACPGGSNSANHFRGDFALGYPYYRSTVGCYSDSESPYATFDQGGNMFEWYEAVIGSGRGIRGGSFVGSSYLTMGAKFRFDHLNPADEWAGGGFRVAEVSEQAAVPAVSEWGMVAMVLLVLVGGTLLISGRRTEIA